MLTSLAEFRAHFPAVAAHSSSDDLDALLASMTRLQIAEGVAVIEDGDRSAPLHFVMEGKLRCYLEKDGERVEIGQILPGQYIGEVSILDGGPATATVIADCPCTLLELTGAGFKSLERTNPQLASTLVRTIIKLLVERLRAVDQLLYDAVDGREQPSITSAHLNPREWVLRVFAHLSGSEGTRP